MYFLTLIQIKEKTAEHFCVLTNDFILLNEVLHILCKCKIWKIILEVGSRFSQTNSS